MLEPDPPGLTVIPPLFDREKSKPLPLLLTVSVNCYYSCRLSPSSYNVIAYDAQLVVYLDDILTIGRRAEIGVTTQLGTPPQPPPPLNPGVAPLGSPLTESVTGCVDPVTSV